MKCSIFISHQKIKYTKKQYMWIEAIYVDRSYI